MKLKIRQRIIYALLMRELITRYGRDNIGFAWLFLEPLIFTLGVLVLWSFTRHSINASGINISVAAFAITGYSSVLVWRNSTFRTAKAIEPNKGLLFHKNVSVLDLFLSRIILELAGSTVSFCLLTSVFWLLGEVSPPNDLLYTVAAWLYLCWFAVALGLIVGAISELSETFDRFWHVVTYLLFPLSGALFFAAWIPEPLRDYVLYLPMVNGVEMLRHGFFGDYITTYENLYYMVFLNFWLTLVGIGLVFHVSKKICIE